MTPIIIDAIVATIIPYSRLKTIGIAIEPIVNKISRSIIANLFIEDSVQEDGCSGRFAMIMANVVVERRVKFDTIAAIPYKLIVAKPMISRNTKKITAKNSTTRLSRILAI